MATSSSTWLAMKCPPKLCGNNEVIVDYCAGKLDPDTTATFERHADSCAACSSVVAEQRTLWAALDEWHEMPVSPDFDHKLFQQIAEADSGGRRSPLPWFRWRRALKLIF